MTATQLEIQPAWLPPMPWPDGTEAIDLRSFGTMRLQVVGLSGGDSITVFLSLDVEAEPVALRGVSNQLQPVGSIIADGVYTFGAGGFVTWLQEGSASNPTIIVGAGA